MKFNIWDKPDTWVSEKGMRFEDSSIIEAKRFFYLFFDNNDLMKFKEHTERKDDIIYGKAIQINLSLSKGGNDNIDLTPWNRGSNNSTYMVITMYIYDTVFPGSVMNFKDAKFLLTESLTSGTNNDYDIHKALLCGTQIYSKDVRDKDYIKSCLYEQTCGTQMYIPEPQYYTMRQQELIEDDVYCITSLSTSIEHMGWELLDDVTSISIMDILEMDSLEQSMKDKLYQARYSIKQSNYKINTFDSTELSDYMLYHDFMSMQHGYTYIYDTNMGTNIIQTKKAFIPFVKHQFRDKLQYEIEQTLGLIKNYAKNVENELGSVRLTFTPLYYGDKIDAYFKDWNKDHQPTIKNNVGIDNGFKLKNDISDSITAIQEQEA
jgi:hypothetical protein